MWNKNFIFVCFGLLLALQIVSAQVENLANDIDDKIARNFRDRRQELELVRTILTQHKQMLGHELSQLSVEDESDTVATAANATVVDQNLQHSEKGEAEEKDQIHRTAPEILHVNRHFKDYLYQGDMALTADQAKYILSNRRKRQSINGEKYPEFKWDRNVSYSFDETVDADTKVIIGKALEFWQSHTCLNFDEDDEASSRLAFFKGDGCWSYVGKVTQPGEPQPVSIGEGCEHFIKFAVASHEIAHALGFFHAQSRHDRDAFVRFRVRNVEHGYEDQFGKEEQDTNNNYGVKYDYGSVLHYSDNAFAKFEGKPVLLAQEPHNQNTMGQRIKPSFSDVLIMNRHYSCLENCAKSETKCENGGYPHPKNCSICICPWGFEGEFCTERQSANGDLVAKECGKTVEATSKWAELNATIGSGEKVLHDDHSSCHFHIKAPKGRKIQLKLLQIGRVCSSGCFYGNIEFKVGDDFSRTGHRMCCASDIRRHPILRSKTNVAVISMYTRFYLQSFKVHYRYV